MAAHIVDLREQVFSLAVMAERHTKAQLVTLHPADWNQLKLDFSCPLPPKDGELLFTIDDVDVRGEVATYDGEVMVTGAKVAVPATLKIEAATGKAELVVGIE